MQHLAKRDGNRGDISSANFLCVHYAITRDRVGHSHLPNIAVGCACELRIRCRRMSLRIRRCIVKNKIWVVILACGRQRILCYSCELLWMKMLTLMTRIAVTFLDDNDDVKAVTISQYHLC